MKTTTIRHEFFGNLEVIQEGESLEIKPYKR